MNNSHRILHRLTPFHDELLTGFLMRVSFRNHMLGPEELMGQVLNGGARNISYSELPKLAYLCLNTIDEVKLLSGYEQWNQGEARWWIASEWVTKSAFVMNRHSKVCPACLSEHPYLRGIWNLSFYTVCARHETRLVDTCPNCQKPLKWNRRRPDYCGCKQNLAKVDTPVENSQSLNLAKLIAYRAESDPTYLRQIRADEKVIERLAGLSIDGLCKTVWFLGYCLDDTQSHGAGHGRRKPRPEALEMMIVRTFNFLRDWPDSLGQALKTQWLGRLGPEFLLQDSQRVLAPVEHYFKSSLTQPELAFLVRPYEQYLQHIWRFSGKHHPRSDFARQLLLPL